MIEIDYPNEAKIYCPACGTLILSSGESGDEFGFLYQVAVYMHVAWTVIISDCDPFFVLFDIERI